MAANGEETNGDLIDAPNEEETDPTNFKFHKISKQTRKLLKENGYKSLFPVQYLTYQDIFSGKDTLVQARTGTGKTLAFVLPLVEKLRGEEAGGLRPGDGRLPLVLVLAPTRELVQQIWRDFSLLTAELRVLPVYGGVPYQPQIDGIERGTHVLVGAPGRVLDLASSGRLELSGVRHVVLDEADQLLERGFTEDIEKILSHTRLEESVNKTQLLMFSATLPGWVENMTEKYMSRDHTRADLIGSERVKTSTTVAHKALKCPYSERHSTLGDVVQMYATRDSRVMVFCPTKVEANEVSLSNCIRLSCQVLHGDIPQKQREVTLEGFRKGSFQCLVTTDVASRGLDIPEVDLVVQCEPPKDIHAYIHRAGRTGRAGREGVCIIFYKASQELQIRRIEQVAGIHFTRIGAPQPSDLIENCYKEARNSLAKIPPDIIQSFRPSADALISERGAADSVAAALALISGYTQMQTRSLLSGQKDFCALQIKVSTEARAVSYFWAIIRRYLDNETMDNIKGLRMCEDHRGCVFDVPARTRDEVVNLLSNLRDVEICVPNELPALVDVALRTDVSGVKRRNEGREGAGYKRGRNGFSRGPERDRFGGRSQNSRFGRDRMSNGFARKYQASRNQN